MGAGCGETGHNGLCLSYGEMQSTAKYAGSSSLHPGWPLQTKRSQLILTCLLATHYDHSLTGWTECGNIRVTSLLEVFMYETPLGIIDEMYLADHTFQDSSDHLFLSTAHIPVERNT